MPPGLTAGRPVADGNTDDDTYVFWYGTPAPESPAAFAALLGGWIEAGVVPRQGTPLEVASRAADGSVTVRDLPPPRTPEDALKLLASGGEGARIPSVKGQADLFLAGASVRARIHFEYAGDDELDPPRVDPRRPFMTGVLVLPRNWRDDAPPAGGKDPGERAAALEDALAEKYLAPIAERTAPLTGLAGPEHDSVRWLLTADALAKPLPPRLSDLSRYATYLSPAQVGAVGAEHFARLQNVFEWLHEKQPRLAPYCRLTAQGGAIVARWPGTLDREPKFVALLSPGDRESFHAVRTGLLGPG